ncbi:MAG: class I tRNA ligase family protein [Patescibacteria group bacterium]
MDEPKKSAQALREEEILAFWQAEKIFEQSLSKMSPKGEFVFYDGPPFATGLPHYGHILAGTIKDVIPRYKTMQGFHVRRRWGWDCHGLPLENIVEKELNLNHKKEIEAYGIGNFNEQARKSVLRFTDDWKKIIPRLGRFVDMEDDYRSLDASYSESVWWIFKTLYDRGLIYEGYKSMQICPRCETTLANFEVNQGYKDITDISVFVKFKLADEANTYLVAWTTTPWTLPGNVALAVGPDIDYVKVKIKDSSEKELSETYIVAKERLVLGFPLAEGTHAYVIETFKGSDLIGLSYEPVFDYYSKPDEKELQRRSALSPRESASWDNGWKVYGADFVTTDDGTGIVHIAPAFGEDDLKLGQANNLPFIQHVKMDGTFKSEVTDLAGQSVKPIENPQVADIEIIKLLAAKGAFLAKEKIIHSYPHCWRCDTPLLNYASSSWFVKVTDLRDKLIAANQGITWVPEHIKNGRFGKWLEGARDWAISRSRFWGAPLPVWCCPDCQKLAVMGSLADLQTLNQPAKNSYQVMRHGETTGNLTDKISFKTEAEDGLTELGQKQVQQASQILAQSKIDLIISSPFRRTRETAEILAQSLDLPAESLIFDKCLQEADPGNLDGLTWLEYQTEALKNDSRRETLVAIRARVMSLLFELEQRYVGKNILIVSHGLPLRLMLLASEGLANRELLSSPHWQNSVLTNAEIRQLQFKPYPHNLDFDLDFHRPYIDEVKLPCACGGEMARVPEVFDCWFESGSMPYAQDHYPFNNNRSLIDPEQGIGFPADFIAEGIDQTRGWFYSLLVLGVALFDQSPFKNVIVNGMVLAEDGQKMAKRLKNYPDPLMVVDKYGADALRLYLLLAPIMRGEDLNLTEKGIGEVARRILARLDNVLTFFLTYGDLNGAVAMPALNNILDQWLSARLAETINLVSLNLDRYELDKAARAIDDFIDDLSNWYVRRSRDRFRSDDSTDRDNANATLRYVLIEAAKIMAPFTPFMADNIYRQLGDANKLASVHLEAWPANLTTNAELISLMLESRQLSTLGLELRARAGIKVRQPLAKITIQSETLAGQADLLAILAEELNVKTIAFDSKLTVPAELDLEIGPELKAEGLARDLMRLLQEGRKQAGFSPADLADLEIYLSGELVSVWQQFEPDIKKVAKLKQVKIVDQAIGETLKLDQAEVAFKLERAS